MRYGIQMFGINPVFQKDPEAFLRRITAAGYRYLEPCLMMHYEEELSSHAWTLDDLAAYGPLLARFGVKINSAIIFTADLAADAEKLIPAAKSAGMQQIVMLSPEFESEEQYRSLVPQIRKTAAVFQAAGLELLMHNGGPDCAARIGGISAYEWLLREAGGCLYAQPDVGWMLWGGVDPEEFLWRNQALVRSFHYKDFVRTAGGMQETEIGTGLVDMAACFQFARYAEVIQYADQDSSEGDFLAAMERVCGRFHSLENCRDNTSSTLCVIDSISGEVRELCHFDGVIEAPNWYQQDADALFYNSEGHIYRYSISRGESVLLDTGTCNDCNNDHVLSADGRQIAVSHSDGPWMSRVYILPIEGGTPRKVTENYPSFLHGWSPDGKELVYCAFRRSGEETKVNVYGISAEGGEEYPLTQEGFNDGPEFSPDGRHILFISTRSGLMQNWRMNRDGSDPVQLTFSERNNWFGHYSPDGRHIAYISYSKEGLDPNQHLPNMQVELHVMDADGSNDRLLLRLFGGQGTVNVNSWSPDNRHFAFVKYELKHK